MTVIIPCCDAADCIANAIDSARQQTLAPTEVIVVEVGASAATRSVAEHRGARYEVAEGCGLAAARNLGLAVATSDFVAFLDAHDWYEPIKIERSLSLLQRLGAACLATETWLVIGDTIEPNVTDRLASEVLTEESLLGVDPIIDSTIVGRRAALLEAGGFNGDPGLDGSDEYDLWLRLARREPIAFLREPLTFRRRIEASPETATRHLRSRDLVLDRVAHIHANEPHFSQLIARRRAALRLDVARALHRSGRRVEARSKIAEARRLAPSWQGNMMWLSTLLPMIGRRA
ncbi:MAG: glycosyltransferase family 2 protein [Planctomycetes bacterium]|nr:glycosyltransferase family 2 protein [Planctomycetota bacterium]